MLPVPSGALSAGHLSRPQVWGGVRAAPHIPVPTLQTHLAFLPSLLASWPPGRRAGSELESLRFLGLPGPRRAGLRELSSLLGATERMLRNFKTLHPRPTEGIVLRGGMPGAR